MRIARIKPMPEMNI